eukprot:maker-scaffold999_size72078-snap-gene-0.11 protein:Tk06780 transcript:maker-scaffold999_size72078-snap-gene-0.11-mRNA-1 annotation:"zinc finger protein 564-like isoform x1"
MLKTFGTIQFYAYNRCLLPAMKSEGCIGLMGLVKRGEDSLRGRMIVRHWQSPSSNPDQELSNLTDLISQVFGLPRLAIFKWSEMVPEGEGKTYTECWTVGRKRSLAASMEYQGEVEAAFETISSYEKHSNHVHIHEMKYGKKHSMKLEMVDDLPWTEVKNMALVMRKSLTGRLGLKPLLSQNCLDKFLAQARACPKIEDKRLTHPQLCRPMLEVFKWLVNVDSKDIVQRFPAFGEEFRNIRKLWNMTKNVDFSAKRSSSWTSKRIRRTKHPNAEMKQCGYCGKIFPCFSAYDNMLSAWHLRKCKLDRTTCACDIAFSSPKDKRTHMLLKHSDGRKRSLAASMEYQGEVEAAFETISSYEKHSNHVHIHEMKYGKKHSMKLEMVDDLPWTEVKNMALVMRKSLTGRLGLKPLLSQNCLDKFLAQARACPKIEDKRLTHPQLCRSMLEVFKWLVNVDSKDMVQRFPAFGEEFQKIRKLWNMTKNVDFTAKHSSSWTSKRIRRTKHPNAEMKQCEYCGKTFPCFSAYDNMLLVWHLRKCKLERTTCACDIAFSSPKDKRTHMLLKHSDGNYLKCNQCLFLTKEQKVLDKHVDYYHGFPGREEICSLCQKSFRCRNHLSQHQFNHKSHYCTPCGQEFLGRLNFRRHMDSEHGAGFPCELCGKIPLVENQINLGLSSSDLECLRQQEEQANQEESKLALPLPLEENHNDLPEIGHGIVEVEMLKTFGTLHFYACKRCLLPAMKSEGCIGLMGLVKTGEDSLKGRMIVRHWQSPSSNPDQELSNLTNLISQVFGLPRLAIFKWSEMVPEGEGKTFTECWTKHKRESMASKNNQQKVEAALETMSDYGKHLTHVDVHELSFGSKHVMELDVVEDLPWGEIKNMALVMRKSLTGRLGLKPLLSQDCMDKFLAQARSCPKIENNRLTHPQFCRSMLEVFKCLANVRSKNMVTRFPSFGREFREIRSLWNIFKNVDLSRIRDSQDVQSKSFLVKQCEYCGKTITCFTAGDNMALAGHTRKCKLRRTACACGIAFSSAKDRQKHMLLKHSNGTCMKCDQCRYLTQDQKAMDNHVEHYHGFPGREEVCSLCMKSFRCRNHLNHHQFTHESHFCTPCGQEFLGRLPFRRHMKSEHGAGFPCKVCGKVPFVENQIEFGLSSSDLDCLGQQEEQVNQIIKPTLPLPLEEIGEHHPEIEPGIVEVEMLKTFGTLHFYACKRCLLPAMKSEGCIGLMGLVTTGEDSLKGQMIVQPWQSPSSNPGEELSNLTDLISQVFGLPRLAIFKRAEMDKPKTCQYQALNNAYAQSLGSRNPVPFSPPVKRARLTPTVEPPISKASNKAEEVHTKVEEAIDIWDEPDLDDPTPSESLDDPTPLESLEDTIFPDLVDDPSSAEPLVDLMPPDPATSSIPSTVPTNQNYLELLPNPYLEISPELKDLLLWLNGQPLCHRAHDPSLPPDFDVLRGYPRHYYGLFPSKNWRYHLTYLLMKLPHFRHNHSLFFASIFRQSPVYWNGKMLALKKIINGEHLSASHATICPKEKDFVALVQNPLIANQIDFGLSSSELERLRQQEEQVKQDSQPLPLEEVGEDLPEIELGIIEVEMLKTFGTIQFYAYNRCLLPAMKSEGCIGLMGLVKT